MLEFAWGMAYRGRGGAGCVAVAFAFCCARCLEMERETESSEEEDSTLRRGGRTLGVAVDMERGTTDEKLPGARSLSRSRCCWPVVDICCDMVVCGCSRCSFCEMHRNVSHGYVNIEREREREIEKAKWQRIVWKGQL